MAGFCVHMALPTNINKSTTCSSHIVWPSVDWSSVSMSRKTQVEVCELLDECRERSFLFSLFLMRWRTDRADALWALLTASVELLNWNNWKNVSVTISRECFSACAQLQLNASVEQSARCWFWCAFPETCLANLVSVCS